MSGLLGNIISPVKAFAGGVTDLILPSQCCGCFDANVTANNLCENCNRDLLDFVTVPYCMRCGSQLGPNIPPNLDGCSRCDRVLPRFQQVFRIGAYRPPLSDIVRNFKYHRKYGAVRHLTAMLSEHILQQCEDDFDLIVPVPMYWSRKLIRGYNHATVLAKLLGRHLEIPVGEELIRIRNTPAQVNLPRTVRLENIRGAFTTRKNVKLNGAKILLVDDVTTTGATANEAARVLIKAGAFRVKLATLAKSEPPTAYAEIDKLFKRPGWE